MNNRDTRNVRRPLGSRRPHPGRPIRPQAELRHKLNEDIDLLEDLVRVIMRKRRKLLRRLVELDAAQQEPPRVQGYHIGPDDQGVVLLYADGSEQHFPFATVADMEREGYDLLPF